LPARRCVAIPHLAGMIATLYMIVPVFAFVHLLEETRRLREESKSWEMVKLHTAPAKPRFYHRR